MRACVLLLLLTASARADTVLLKKVSWGSVAAYNPLAYYLNTAFDTAQNPFYFSQERFFSNHGKLFDRVTHVGRAMDEIGGWGKFFATEFFGKRAVPNWTLHLIGGGYDFRYLSEWYRDRGVPKPHLLAFLTCYLANIGNEALETTATQVPATDHIADLFFFDLVGKFLFLNDDVARFFHEDLQMRPWAYQPVLSLNDLRIQNAGLNYVFRPRWLGEGWRPFVHMGLVLLAGVSRHLTAGDWLSIGLGVVPTDPLELKGDFVAGFYWDRDDSLLASLTLGGSSNLAFRLNLYPGVIQLLGWDLGLFLGVGKQGRVAFGADVSLPIGVGAAF